MATLEMPPLRRSKSRSRLASLFSRSKVPDPDEPMPKVYTLANGAMVPRPPTPEIESPTPFVPAVERPTTSKSMKEFSSNRYSRVLLKSTSSPSRPKTTTTTVAPSPDRPHKALLKPNWEAPPLFQAYPQALKQATLLTSSIAAETIIKNKRPKRRRSTMMLNAEPEKESKHKRQPSATLSGGSLTNKIYLLMTSGYLLRYAAEGNYDRLPEKILRLGRSSVAFVSNAIDEHRWVLQVSHGVHGEESPEGHSIFSKLSFRSSTRASTSALLMIFSNVEEMDSWMVAVRKEIAYLGGREPTPEVGVSAKVQSQQESPGLRRSISQRFNVKRDPFQFAPPVPAITPDLLERERERDSGHRHFTSDESVSTHPRSSQRDSFDSPSMATTISTSDHVKISTARSSGSSYATATTELPPDGTNIHRRPSLPLDKTSFNSAVTRRKSMATLQTTAPASPPRPKSSYITTLQRPASRASPVVPNFSFPHPPIPRMDSVNLNNTSFLDDAASESESVDMQNIMQMEEDTYASDDEPSSTPGTVRPNTASTTAAMSTATTLTTPFVPPKRFSSLLPLTQPAPRPASSFAPLSAVIPQPPTPVSAGPAPALNYTPPGSADGQIAQVVRLQYRKSMPSLAILASPRSLTPSLPPAGPPPACPLPKTPLELSTPGSGQHAGFFLSPPMLSPALTMGGSSEDGISPISVPGSPLSVGVGETRVFRRTEVVTVEVRRMQKNVVGLGLSKIAA